MQPLVLFVVFGPVVVAAACRQLDAVDEFDVGAVVKLVGMAGRRIFDQETDRAPVFDVQRLAFEPLHHDSFVADRIERHARMKVVGGGVQREIRRRGLRSGPLEKGGQRDAVARTLRIEPADVEDLFLRGEAGEICERKGYRLFDFAIHTQNDFAHDRSRLPPGSVSKRLSTDSSDRDVDRQPGNFAGQHEQTNQRTPRAAGFMPAGFWLKAKPPAD